MKRIKCFGSYVKLLWSTHIVDYGYFQPDQQLITINANHSLKTQQRTLAHELAHVVEDHYGLVLTEDEVDKMGVGMLTILQENKNLVEYLTRE